jgi:hypothetical protein
LHVEDVRLRIPNAAFVIQTDGPVDVPVNTALDFGVELAPTVSGSSEEILFLDITQPNPERLPITLFGSGS